MGTTPNPPQAVLNGNWDPNVSWEFFLSDNLPDDIPCNASFALALMPGNSPEDLRIVMTHIDRTGRGWEMPGGHMEPGETPEQAMQRECLEEGGFIVDGYFMYGYQLVRSKQPVANTHFGGFYPDSNTMAFYVAVTQQPLVAPTGEEVLENGALTLKEIAQLDTNHLGFVRLGLESYRLQQTVSSSRVPRDR